MTINPSFSRILMILRTFLKSVFNMTKAGSYGIQDWMGFVGIKRIEGDFFNVMGLPLHRLYREIEKIIL